MDTIIGIDLGGTNLRLALVSTFGKIIVRKKVLVGSKRHQDEIVDFIHENIFNLKKENPSYQVKGIGMGIPGIVSAKEGIVYSSPHYPHWKNFHLASQLSKKINYPLVMDNDAHMIALGEKWKGAAQDWDSFLMMTLGTGIGGAIVIDSKIFHGQSGFAGEFGHLVINTEGPLCACGSNGCLETYASATALKRMLNEALDDEDLTDIQQIKKVSQEGDESIAHELSLIAEKGNRSAKQIYKKFGYYLGIGIASLVNVTGIEHIVLGGGVVGSSGLFLPSVKEEIKNRTYKETAKRIEIRLAQLRDDAGLLGSAKVAMGV